MASGSDRIRLGFPIAEAAVLCSVLFASSGHLLIKAGLNALDRPQLHQGLIFRLSHCLVNPVVLLGLGIYAVGTVAWVFAVSKREISYLFPLTALNYVLVAVGGRLLLAEPIPPSRWLGIAVVVVGVVVMQLSGREERT